jgi:hypothetical protein
MSHNCIPHLVSRTSPCYSSNFTPAFVHNKLQQMLRNSAHAQSLHRDVQLASEWMPMISRYHHCADETSARSVGRLRHYAWAV